MRNEILKFYGIIHLLSFLFSCHFAFCCQVWSNYLIYPGIMMTLAWVLFAFVGLFTARYMREVWEPRKLLGEKAWFTVSRVKRNKI